MGTENGALDVNPYLGADDTVDPEDLSLEEAEKDLQEEAKTDPTPEETDTDAKEKQEPEQQPEQETEQKKEEVEQQTTEEKEPEPKAEEKPQTIPKARLDKQIKKTRELEQRIAELQGQLKTQSEPENGQEPEAKQSIELGNTKEMAAALLDGDNQKFAELYQANMEAVAEQAAKQAAHEIQKQVPEQVTKNQQQQEFDNVVVELESKYGFLNPAQEDIYDPALEQTIATFTQSFVAQGEIPADALRMAADKVLKIEKPELFTEPKQEKKVDVDAIRKERMNLEKKLEAAKAQPPAIEKGAVEEPPIPDFETMSDEAFDKLTVEEQDALLERMKKTRS